VAGRDPSEMKGSVCERKGDRSGNRSPCLLQAELDRRDGTERAM
jgi:hypothetical protein